MFKERVIVPELGQHVGRYIVVLRGNVEDVALIRSFDKADNKLRYTVQNGQKKDKKFSCKLRPEQTVWVYDDDTVVDALLNSVG